MRANAIAAALLLSSGCHRDTSGARIDGKGVDVATALVSTSGGSKMQVLLSPLRVRCEAFTADRPLAEHDVLLEVAPQLLVPEKLEVGYHYVPAPPNTLLVWGVTWKTNHGTAHPITYVLGTDTPPYALSRIGDKLRGHLAFDDPGVSSRLAFDGEIALTSCGDHPNSKPVLATAKVVGRDVAVRGALMTKSADGASLLELSSSGEGCDGVPGGTKDLGALLFLNGSPGHPSRVSVYGDLLPGEQVEDNASFEVHLTEGSARIDGDGAVLRLHATLPVTTCPKR